MTTRGVTHQSAYREDLAYIHDAGFGRFALGAAELLIAELRRRGSDRGLVIDLGCGSGILAEKVAAAGYDVLGIDISEGMIALARQRVPNGRFRIESLLSAELPPCVAIAAVGECFNYLFDESHSPEALRRVLGRAFEALIPGGVLVFDVVESGRVTGPGPQKNHAEGDGWAVLVTAEEDSTRQVLARRIISFRKVGDLYRRDEEVHCQRLFSRALLVSWLNEIGFQVETLASYGSVPFLQGHAGFLARKL